MRFKEDCFAEDVFVIHEESLLTDLNFLAGFGILPLPLERKAGGSGGKSDDLSLGVETVAMLVIGGDQ